MSLDYLVFMEGADLRDPKRHEREIIALALLGT